MYVYMYVYVYVWCVGLYVSVCACARCMFICLSVRARACVRACSRVLTCAVVCALLISYVCVWFQLNDIDDRTDRLILRFIDTIIEDARQEGVPPEMLSSMMRKRSGIRKCFFHAINCW